jgi:hypothetical protein
MYTRGGKLFVFGGDFFPRLNTGTEKTKVIGE